ncbi:hypothetical protein BHM03_00062478 [Ensete ventricosum]|nr:hypothetical protein BHM03_00062478 [Ensete ventricosum]
MMRLNRVESFYAFLLCFYSEGSPCKGQQPRGHDRLRPARKGPRRDRKRQPPATRLQEAAARCKAARGSPAARAAACGKPTRASCPRRDRKRQPPATRLQEAAARCKAARGSPAARAAAGRSGHQQGQRPCKAAPPAHEVSPEGSNAYRRGGCPHRRCAAPQPAQGQQRRRRRGVKERARASF